MFGESTKYRECLLALALLLTPSLAQATQVIPTPFPRLVQRSQVIVQARVLNQRVEWSPDKLRILTLTKLQVLEAFRGAKVGDLITVYQVGGELDGVVQRLIGNVPYRPGEEIFFFGKNFRDMVVIFGKGTGKFVIDGMVDDATVRSEVGSVQYVSPKDGRLLPGVAGTSHPKTLAGFRARLAELIGAQP